MSAAGIRPARERGFSMVEALVALLVLSAGLLGLALLQGQGMRFNTDAYLRTQATTLAYDILDRMQANASDGGLGAQKYEVKTSSAAASAISAYASCKESACACDTDTACDAANLAKFDLGQWYAAQARLLPIDKNNYSTIKRDVVSGSGCPNITFARYTVTMRWVERESPRSQTWSALITECPQSS